MNKDDRDKKQNISISIHEELITLIEKYCKKNKLKKSKFIENILKEHFNNEKTINN
jgi:metal-responsive CopG/Arc/MetJ family transcriptional regulator